MDNKYVNMENGNNNRFADSKNTLNELANKSLFSN